MIRLWVSSMQLLDSTIAKPQLSNSPLPSATSAPNSSSANTLQPARHHSRRLWRPCAPRATFLMNLPQGLTVLPPDPPPPMPRSRSSGSLAIPPPTYLYLFYVISSTFPTPTNRRCSSSPTCTLVPELIPARGLLTPGK
jgi:hypothetical protein